MLASHLSPGMVGIIRQPPCLFEERTYILRITYGVVPKAKENLPGVFGSDHGYDNFVPTGEPGRTASACRRFATQQDA
jgi:hypothetical protein